MFGDERVPRIVLHLLDAERDAALFAVHVEHLHVDFLRRAQDLRRMQVLLGPAHFADVHQAFNARLQFNERAVVGDVGDAAGELAASRVLRVDAVPRIGQQLLHAERNALGVRVDLDDLDFHRVAHIEHLARVRDALPAHVGDVQQAVDAAEVHERAVIGDVLDHAFADFAFLAAGRRFRRAPTRGSLRARRGARRRCCRAGGPSSGSRTAARCSSAGRRRAPGGCRLG